MDSFTAQLQRMHHEDTSQCMLGITVPWLLQEMDKLHLQGVTHEGAPPFARSHTFWLAEGTAHLHAMYQSVGSDVEGSLL